MSVVFDHKSSCRVEIRLYASIGTNGRKTGLTEQKLFLLFTLFFFVPRLAVTPTMAALAVSHAEHSSGGVCRVSHTTAWPAGGWGRCAR